MKDMVDLKQSMETLKTSQQKTELQVTALQQEVKELKRENQRLTLENRQFGETFNAVKENFTHMNDLFLEFAEQFEEKREVFEKNTSAILGDLKVEVRYLSITHLDLNKHTLELDKSIPALIEQKYETLSTKLNTSLDTLNNDLLASSANISKSVFYLENSQNTRVSSMFDEMNKTIGDIRSDVKQSQYDQMKLTSTVSSLEVFRMNVTRNKCDLSRRVAFTAGVTSSSTSWNSGTLVYNKVINNVGGGYNPNTGIFTAPVVGDYVFYVTIQSHGSNEIDIDIVLNGSSKVRAEAYTYSANERYDVGTNLVTLQLQKGDTVWVRYYSGTGYYTHSDVPTTTFSGFLL
ncbi:multimerin-2-like [Saccostrea cucullata]|uniref:multimerin-2-like n=1 Tax=Saccostrea cuccullata TaxID=36930 RepID=UPI002ED568D8